MAWMRAAWLAILGSCTPLGLWIYEYPVVTVSRVTLEVSLLLDGIPIGQMRQDSDTGSHRLAVSGSHVSDPHWYL